MGYLNHQLEKVAALKAIGRAVANKLHKAPKLQVNDLNRIPGLNLQSKLSGAPQVRLGDYTKPSFNDYIKSRLDGAPQVSLEQRFNNHVQSKLSGAPQFSIRDHLPPQLRARMNGITDAAKNMPSLDL